MSIDISTIIFQQDNATPCFKHNKTMVQGTKNQFVDWPPQYPDLNIIENVWNFLDTRVRKRINAIFTLDYLWKVLVEEAGKIPEDYIISLYKYLTKSMTKLNETVFYIEKC